MERLLIGGGARLEGSVKVESAKNAVLPIIAAALLVAEGVTVIKNVPPLEDVLTICRLLEHLGAETELDEDSGDLAIDATNIDSVEAPYDLVRRMRASVLVAGPLLSRVGEVKVALPGGCAIGTRPIDLHMKGFNQLGAETSIGQGCIKVQKAAHGPRLTGNRIYLDMPSVGATENIMMAAAVANGTTIVENAAEEPEVVDLANFLNTMGADIRGAGTSVIRITGVSQLRPVTYEPIPDRIEAGTYMMAGAITAGDIYIHPILPEHLKSVTAKLREMGILVIEGVNSIRVTASDRPRAVDIKTQPYPGFPTDLQAPALALLATATGTSVITETVFENRFMHVDELKRMGASIKTDGRTAVVTGVERLDGAPVKATDIRAGAALLVAALAAAGESELTELHHLDRGYVNLVPKLRELGANIERYGDLTPVAEADTCQQRSAQQQ